LKEFLYPPLEKTLHTRENTAHSIKQWKESHFGSESTIKIFFQQILGKALSERCAP
jgi:hypothetical protein